MAVPSLSQTGAHAGTTNTATISPTIPAGATAGEIAVAFLVHPNELVTMTTVPTGWTLIQYEQTNTDHTSAVYWAEVTSGGSNDPGTSPSWVWSAADRITGAIATFSGVDTTTPIDTAAAVTTTNAINITVASFTTTAADALIVGVVTGNYTVGTGASAWTITGETATEIWDRNDLGATGEWISSLLFSTDAATAGSYGTWVCTNTDTNAVADDLSAVVFSLAAGADPSQTITVTALTPGKVTVS